MEEEKVERSYENENFEDIRNMYILDMSPLEIIDYKEYDSQATIEFFENLRKDGFEFSDDEIGEWNEFLSEHSNKENVKVE